MADQFCDPYMTGKGMSRLSGGAFGLCSCFFLPEKKKKKQNKRKKKGLSQLAKKLFGTAESNWLPEWNLGGYKVF